MADDSIEPAPIWDDITTLKREHFDLPIDIIVGGFPCQDISVAGKGEGIIEGNRSGLFFEVLRLTDELRPKFLFLENVPAIRTRGLDVVLQELTQRGYDCRWTMLSAAQVGANHKRERWFLLAHSSSQRIRQDSGAVSREQNTRDEVGRNGLVDSGSDVADTVRNGFASSQIRPGIESYNDRNSSGQNGGTLPERRQKVAGCSDSLSTKHPHTGSIESRLGRMVDGVSCDMDKSRPSNLAADYWQEEPNIPRITQEKEQRTERIKRLGNAVVPLQAKTAFEYLFGVKNVH
jgi:DNA (cytosine-5)-methyltransferase 1